MTITHTRFTNGWMIVFCSLLSVAIYSFAPHTYPWAAGFGVAFSGVMEHTTCFILQTWRKR